MFSEKQTVINVCVLSIKFNMPFSHYIVLDKITSHIIPYRNIYTLNKFYYSIIRYKHIFIGRLHPEYQFVSTEDRYAKLARRLNSLLAGLGNGIVITCSVVYRF